MVPSTGAVSSRRLSSSAHWSPIGISGRVRSLEGREPRRTRSKRGRSEDEVGKGRSQALGPTFSILVASFDRCFYSLHSSSCLFCASSCFYSVHSLSFYSVQVRRFLFRAPIVIFFIPCKILRRNCGRFHQRFSPSVFCCHFFCFRAPTSSNKANKLASTFSLEFSN